MLFLHNEADQKKYAFRDLPQKAPHIIGIGSSTGGTEAVRDLLSNLEDVPTPILVTQHILVSFSKIFVENLKKLLKKNIVSGQHNQEIQDNTIYVAPANCHMEVCPSSTFPHRIILTNGPPENFCKPSVDPMFRSIARRFRQNAMGVVLTGIGQDGLIGATEIVKNGGSIIAQSKETCVVWGMPKAIVENGLACTTLSPKQIGDYITALYLKGTLL